MANKETGNQPRKEFVIILNELTNNSDGTFKQKNHYVEVVKKHGINIDERRVTLILDHIYQLAQEGLLRFKIEASDNKRKKYRCTEFDLDENTIVSIGTAIRADSTMTKKQQNELIDKFVKHSTPKYKADNVREKINSAKVMTDSRVSRIPQVIVDAYNNHKKAVVVAIRKDSSFYCYPEQADKHFRDGQLACRVLDIFDKESNDPKIILWHEPIRSVAVVHLSDLVQIDASKVAESKEPNTKFPTGSKYKTYEEWDKDYFSGKIGKVEHIVIKVPYATMDPNEDKNVLEVARSLADYYKINDTKSLKTYKKTRTVKKADMGYDNGVFTTSTKEVNEIYFEIDSNADSFRRWYKSKMSIIEKVVIVSPKRLNNEILTPLISKFSERIVNFGESTKN
ncbi:MAG: hypothetical protein IJ247_03435 [Bacilli bacterium]|nr:hypothetical protein [Bacilli bacterium]